MNKKILTTLSLCVIGVHGTSQVTAQGACTQVTVPPVCQGGSQININNMSKEISPPNLCATPGEAITVRVTPPGTTAIMHGKDGGWPYASNGSNETFTIIAPGDGEYNYNVTFEDGTCIDPRITVKR